MDLLPTFIALAGAELPADRVIDGRDISALMRGEPGATSPHEAFYYYRETRLDAVRSGPWKLVFPPPRGGTNPSGCCRAAGRFGGSCWSRSLSWPLYNLQTDISEQVNVAAEHPDVVERLRARWQTRPAPSSGTTIGSAAASGSSRTGCAGRGALRGTASSRRPG